MWRYLVLYDGNCGLCDRSVQWLLVRDRGRLLHFSPLQGETAREVVSIREPFETIVLVERLEDGRIVVRERSRAFLRIFALLGGFWGCVSWFRVLPAFLTDLPYRLIARIRYRVWGRLDACRMPAPEDRDRFLP
jgi:predicted DCC family thiol-disulfide oxidoreductase YuxK